MLNETKDQGQAPVEAPEDPEVRAAEGEGSGTVTDAEGASEEGEQVDELAQRQTELQAALARYKKDQAHASVKITEQGQELATLRQERDQLRQQLTGQQGTPVYSPPSYDNYGDADLSDLSPGVVAKLSQYEQGMQVIAQTLLDMQEQNRQVRASADKQRKLDSLRAASGIQDTDELDALATALDEGDYDTVAKALALGQMRQAQTSEAQRRRRAETVEAVAPGGASTAGATRDSALMQQFNKLTDTRKRQQFIADHPELIEKLGLT